MSHTCWIFGAGEYGSLSLTPAQLGDSFVIAADGGLDWLEGQGIRPHLAVGDFDSLGRVPSGVPVVRHPAEKDDTDMMLAVEEGLARGCRRFFLWGGLGGRLDHTLANLHLLDFLAGKGCEGFLLGDTTAITALRGGTLAFPPGQKGILSVFAWGGPAEGVTLCGLRYELENGTLTPHHPLGVSNEFIGTPATVSVRNGTLLVLWERSGERLADLPHIIG